MLKKTAIAISLFFLVNFFISLIPFDNNKYTHGNNIKEKFADSLSVINSMDKLMCYIENKIPEAKNIKDTGNFVREVSLIVEDRFAHALAKYSFQDNFILYYFSLVTFNIEHRAIVDPDDIIKYPFAICSQQSIVFQEVMQRKKIKYASIRLVGHFCSGVFHTGNWYLVDTDREIDYSGLNEIPTLRQICEDTNLINKLYAKKIIASVPEGESNQKAFTKVSIDHINSFPAPKIIILQKTTAWFSKYGFLFALVILWMTLKKSKKSDKYQAIAHPGQAFAAESVSQL